MPDQDDLTRRQLMQISAAAALSSACAGMAMAGEPKPRFFSKDEFAMVDELTELIIPADDHSPGARAAGVAAYLDGRLTEAFQEAQARRWREGLQRIDVLSRQMHDRPFQQSTAQQRTALLTRISRNEENPQTPEEEFFCLLKSATVHAYYTSQIGIHREMEYKGNVLLPEFVGYDVK